MKYTILCEDSQSACFIRRFLKKRHIGRKDIREEISPAGQGCGEQWVRQQYPGELTNIRKHKGYLIVCTDADRATVLERIQALDAECRKIGVPARTEDDAAALIIPKRNIETWIKYLHGTAVNEDDDYAPPTHAADKTKCEKAVQTLDEYCRQLRQNPPQLPALPLPDSLQRACLEAKRVF
ncbi:MAG: hypothetical protein LBQ46_06790 [Treponema sp.]|jgi:hypothetical protein|nr:hypothetical protein [Treponema sp.]